VDRRAFLRAGLASAAVVAVGPRLAGCTPNAGPYGALGAADANGIKLPSGFTSSVVAQSGVAVPGTTYPWHAAPDGGATFATPGGGWTYVSNSELGAGAGGASAIRFGPDGAVVGASRILGGTTRNCAGGPTPWGRWLSCEEIDRGLVWECDPSGTEPAVARPALGVFNHEAAAVDPVRGHVYLTEDRPDGRLYRFRPTAYPDLSAGTLEVATVAAGLVQWTPVPDPAATVVPTCQQVPSSTAFNGGEGAWYGNDRLWFTTKGDNRLWELDVVGGRLTVLYDASRYATPVLTGVDNIVQSANGDLYVCEDGGDMQLVIVRPNGEVWPFLQITGQAGSELTGPAFDPSGTRLYFSSQRGPTSSGSGMTYEVRGPFHLS
jgi:secreted PhoX family phosphatase